MTFLSVNAPAKINVHLAVRLRRDDGFHDIESIFVPVSLYDTLRFECTENETPQTQVTMRVLTQDRGLAALDSQDNIVYKAIMLFREKARWNNHISVTITKRIPAGAGLGGGSSDAAATLRALNQLAPNALSAPLMELAYSLGSDVPFFLHAGGGAAFVRGRGEHITPVAMPPYHIVIIKPEFSSATAAAFRCLDAARSCGDLPIKIPELVDAGNAETLFNAPPDTWPFYNDFLSLFLRVKNTSGQFTGILDALRESGSQYAGLSGSGSACFGVFSDKDTAGNACQTLKGHFALVRQARFCELV